jgi:hypothetical protein
MFKFRKKLDSTHRKRGTGVLRITIDNVLAEDLIRFEFCFLKKEVKDFLYELDVWEDGFEVVASGDTYDIEVGIPLSWDTLNPGQVFLFGAFEVIGDEEDPEKFIYKPKNEELFRIDNIHRYRNKIRQIYSDLLTRRA